MIAEFRIPLNLPGVEVLSTEITEGGRLELIETFRGREDGVRGGPPGTRLALHDVSSFQVLMISISSSLTFDSGLTCSPRPFNA